MKHVLQGKEPVIGKYYSLDGNLYQWIAAPKEAKRDIPRWKRMSAQEVLHMYLNDAPYHESPELWLQEFNNEKVRNKHVDF